MPTDPKNPTPRTDQTIREIVEGSDGQPDADTFNCLARLTRMLEQELTDSTIAYNASKLKVHNFQRVLEAIVQECVDHADGAPDANSIGKFANGLLGTINDAMTANGKDDRKDKLVELLESAISDFEKLTPIVGNGMMEVAKLYREALAKI
jgi:hypothetical protein